MKRMKIIGGGHVDVPAEIQRRWGTHSVVLEDRGDHLVLSPAADEAMPTVDPADEHWPTETGAEGGRRASTGAGY